MNAQHWRLEGVVSLLLTPFHADGNIDWAGYDAYVDWQVAYQPHGLFAVCGSSEMKWLAPDERVALARRAVARAGQLPVVATGNLAPAVADHPDEIRRMADTGVAAIVLVPPPQVSGQRDDFQRYVIEMAALAPCPLLLYEWPAAPNHLLEPDLFGALAGHVAGLKDTTCTLEGILAKQQVAGDAVIYQANTAFLVDAWACGVRGVMAITSTVRADWVLRLWEAFHARVDVRALHRDLVVLDALLELGYPATAKHLAARQGVPIAAYTRAPVQLKPHVARALNAWFDGD